MKMKLFAGFSLLFLLLISGCATIPDGVEPLTAVEVRSIFSGNSVYIKGQQFEYSAYLNADGTYKGKAWGSWGEDPSRGTWKITDEGLICYKSSLNNTKNCRKMYPDPKNEKAYIGVNVSGKAKTKIVTYNIFPGNKYNY